MHKAAYSMGHHSPITMLRGEANHLRLNSEQTNLNQHQLSYQGVPRKKQLREGIRTPNISSIIGPT
jgi:hypothetical protein